MALRTLVTICRCYCQEDIVLRPLYCVQQGYLDFDVFIPYHKSMWKKKRAFAFRRLTREWHAVKAIQTFKENQLEIGRFTLSG